MGGPAAAGCVVYKEDVEKIVISCMCFISFISYGASYACLGAALPELADSLGVAHAAFGLAFATRGIGFVLGSLVSAKVLEYPKISKENLECFTIATVGLCGVAISLATNYYVILAIFGFQGVFLALVETTANYMLPIIWGLRVQPWMQAMHACFGIGAIAGPFMIGILGLKAAMAIVSVCAFMPAIALGSFKLFGSNSGISNSGEVNCDTNTLHIGNDSSSSLATDAESISTEQSTNDNKESSTHLATPPLQFRIFSLLFFFIYVGIECGYGGWIPTYSLLVGSSTTNSAAAFLTGTFWGAIAAGRIVAIFTSIYLSTTDGLRMQLAISMIGAIFVFFESSNTYHMTAIGSIIFGYGLSSIFPLCYTIANDYGYQMDAPLVSALAVGTTLGESVLPAIIGYLIKFFGPAALLYSVLISMIILIGIYFGMHVMNKDNSPCNNSISTDGGSDTKGMELPNLGKEINYKKLPSEEFDEVRL